MRLRNLTLTRKLKEVLFRKKVKKCHFRINVPRIASTTIMNVTEDLGIHLCSPNFVDKERLIRTYDFPNETYGRICLLDLNTGQF
jgi:hypothetical protein